MRKNDATEPLFLHFGIPKSELGAEFQKVSDELDRLDNLPHILELILEDLCDGRSSDMGNRGMKPEMVLRAAVLRQFQNWTYRELEFHLSDSPTFRSFCRLPIAWSPSRACLQRNIGAIKDTTWKALRREILRSAKKAGLETGERVRIDSTAVKSPIKHPTDSGLLYDAVKALTRILGEFPVGSSVKFTNHTRRAKKRARQIALLTGKKGAKAKRLVHYKDLLKVARMARGYAVAALANQAACAQAPHLEGLLRGMLELTDKIISQTYRRVVLEEMVPAKDKVVSIYETHTDIIEKGGRETVFGHKVFLTGGRSSMILDCVVEQGNPNDSTRVQSMLERVKDIMGAYPEKASFDAGFTTKDNVDWAEEHEEIKDVSFGAKGKIPVHKAVRSSWMYKNLARFRAGIEGCISMLKRTFGMGASTWKGWEHFKQYVQLAVVSHNLLALSRLRS